MLKKDGVTLIELAVVVSIISIIAILGTAYLRGVTVRYRLDSDAKEMVGRLRMAKVLSISRNSGISVVANTTDSKYYAFKDRDIDGVKDSGEGFFNLDSGKESTEDAATKNLRSDVSMYQVDFNGTDTLTLKPPAGLPDPTLLPPAVLNGVVCFSAVVGDDTYYRRITVSPVVGKVTLWRSAEESPGCPISNDIGWEEVY